LTETDQAARDTRAIMRRQWARQATGVPALELERASSDAGFRSYWRGRDGQASWVVMDSPPALEDVRPWLRMHDLLEQAGVRVPRVHARDVDAGLLLLEDLGSQTYLDLIEEQDPDALFDRAIDQLLVIQRIAPPAGMPGYDHALLQRELELFQEWFLGRHLGIALAPAEQAGLEAINELLIESALAQPQVLVHRDFMPRNLMPAGEGAAVLDFQDAVVGPVAYDPLSLFKDAFHGWPRARVDAWLAHYHQRATAAGVPVPDLARFRRDADLIGVQRHLKVLGIFARLQHRDAKPRYLQDAPRFLRYLAEVLPRHAQLAPLQAVLELHVHPRLAPGPVAG